MCVSILVVLFVLLLLYFIIIRFVFVTTAICPSCILKHKRKLDENAEWILPAKPCKKSAETEDQEFEESRFIAYYFLYNKN